MSAPGVRETPGKRPKKAANRRHESLKIEANVLRG